MWVDITIVFQMKKNLGNYKCKSLNIQIHKNKIKARANIQEACSEVHCGKCNKTISQHTNSLRAYNN